LLLGLVAFVNPLDKFINVCSELLIFPFDIVAGLELLFVSVKYICFLCEIIAFDSDLIEFVSESLNFISCPTEAIELKKRVSL